MLKKQTVWLLTMLSLVVVLSVYYITSPEGGTSQNVALTGSSENKKEGIKENTEKTETQEKEGNESSQQEEPPQANNSAANEQDQTGKAENQDGSMVSTVTGEDLFTALRMELEDARSERKQELESIIGSNDVSAEEKSKAYEEMRRLSELAEKEKVLETLIKTKGYDDALVRADGDQVRITVKAKELSKKQANELIHMVKDEIQTTEDVLVTLQTAE